MVTFPGYGACWGLNIGWYAFQLGQREQALSCCQQALDIFREVGDRRGQAVAHNSIAATYLHLERHAQCLAHCHESADLLGTAADKNTLASTLETLGDAHYATRNSHAAHQAWKQALAILDPAGSPATSQIRNKLHRIQ